jgi:hypothetical protein
LKEQGCEVESATALSLVIVRSHDKTQIHLSEGGDVHAFRSVLEDLTVSIKELNMGPEICYSEGTAKVCATAKLNKKTLKFPPKSE